MASEARNVSVETQQRNKLPELSWHDINEADAVQVKHGGYSSAYGAHVMVVGGADGFPGVGQVNSAIGAPNETRSLRLSSGDRGLFLGQVDSADLFGDRDSSYADAGAVARNGEVGLTADVLEARGRVHDRALTGPGHPHMCLEPWVPQGGGEVHGLLQHRTLPFQLTCLGERLRQRQQQRRLARVGGRQQYGRPGQEVYCARGVASGQSPSGG